MDLERRLPATAQVARRGGGGGGELLAPIDPALLASADAFAITLEPEGGGPVPRGELVLVGVVPKG